MCWIRVEHCIGCKLETIESENTEAIGSELNVCGRQFCIDVTVVDDAADTNDNEGD